MWLLSTGLQRLHDTRSVSLRVEWREEADGNRYVVLNLEHEHLELRDLHVTYSNHVECGSEHECATLQVISLYSLPHQIVQNSSVPASTYYSPLGFSRLPISQQWRAAISVIRLGKRPKKPHQAW